MTGTEKSLFALIPINRAAQVGTNRTDCVGRNIGAGFNDQKALVIKAISGAGNRHAIEREGMVVIGSHHPNHRHYRLLACLTVAQYRCEYELAQDDMVQLSLEKIWTYQTATRQFYYIFISISSIK